MIYNLSDDAFISTGALEGRQCLKLRQYDNRLWAVCDDGSLRFSDNGNADSWDALNVILLPNREPLIDFLPVQGGVILLSRTSAYAMYGSGTYQDTSILPIQDGSAPGSRLMLSDSAVVVDNVAYVLGNKGIHRISLNGMQEIPHDQQEYFDSKYGAWNAINQSVQGIYLYKFRAILYLFQDGSEGLLYYIRNGAICKVGQSLPPDLPFLVEMFDANVDFLFGSGDGTTVCRSIYPAGILTAPRLSTIQTRHEDADSMREKIWRHLAITVERDSPNVLVQAFLDYSETPTFLKYGVVDLSQGDNIIDLYDIDDNLLRSKAISFEINMGGNVFLVSEDTGEVLMAGSEPLVTDDVPTTAANFAIREIRVKWCEVGAPE